MEDPLDPVSIPEWIPILLRLLAKLVFNSESFVTRVKVSFPHELYGSSEEQIPFSRIDLYKIVSTGKV